MRDNINKVSDRGERLDALQDKTDNLASVEELIEFERLCGRYLSSDGRSYYSQYSRWKDMKMRMIIIAVIVVIILIAIIVPC
jgi:vesicle-associated membrane protein 4